MAGHQNKTANYSLENVRVALDSQDVWLTLKNSLYISIVSATLATGMRIGISWIVNRARLKGRRLLEYLALLPIAVPGIAFGIGDADLDQLEATGLCTSLIIMFALVGRFTAHAVRSISSSLVQLHPELEESARIFGYGPFRTFARISLPLILPSVLRLGFAVPLLHCRTVNGYPFVFGVKSNVFRSFI